MARRALTSQGRFSGSRLDPRVLVLGVFGSPSSPYRRGEVAVGPARPAPLGEGIWMDGFGVDGYLYDRLDISPFPYAWDCIYGVSFFMQGRRAAHYPLPTMS